MCSSTQEWKTVEHADHMATLHPGTSQISSVSAVLLRFQMSHSMRRIAQTAPDADYMTAQPGRPLRPVLSVLSC